MFDNMNGLGSTTHPFQSHLDDMLYSDPSTFMPPVPHLPTTAVEMASPEDVSPEIGSVGEVKDLYQSKESYCSCCVVWDETKPRSRTDYLDTTDRSKFAILKRQKKHGAGAWKTHSFVINSPFVRKHLNNLFVEYRNIDFSKSELVFEAPFLPFIHKWKAIEKLHNDEQESTTKAHLKLLIDTLGPETAATIKMLETIRTTGHVSFDDINLLYVVGETLINTSDSQLYAGVFREIALRSSPHEPPYWSVTVDVVDWNGNTFGVSAIPWHIQKFEGSRIVKDVGIVSLQDYPGSEQVKTDLIARGRVFEGLAGSHLKAYDAEAVVSTSHAYLGTIPSNMKIKDRVVVDAKRYYTLQDRTIPSLRPLSELKPKTRAEKDETEIQTKVVDRTTPATNNVTSLSDEECFLAIPYVKGFAFGRKTWCEFQIQGLHDIQWNSHALDQLVLSSHHKRLISGLVSAKVRSNELFDDIVEGKGRGIIFLLSGPPGVGKTLTAETVSEHLERPLYRLSAADLGFTVEKAEAQLTDTLARCVAWNAVLLIDEADVFLEERKIDSLQRNELVSVFLRLLEYYEGIMLLTTNRRAHIDPAFESRIDIAISYPELSSADRAQLIATFLGRLPSEMVKVTAEEITVLSEQPLNGREIKSAVKTARMLAVSEGVPLQKAHLDVVMALRTAH